MYTDELFIHYLSKYEFRNVHFIFCINRVKIQLIMLLSKCFFYKVHVRTVAVSCKKK